MDITTFKYKTIQEINGVSYLYEKQIDDLKYVMCHKLGLELNDEYAKATEEAVKAYFDMQNNIGVS